MESMFDANEERLLTDLLREIGEEDRTLEPAPGLESRMLARWDARASQSPSPRNSWRIGVFAAAAVAAIIGAVTLGERERVDPREKRTPIDGHATVATPDHADPNSPVTFGTPELPRAVRRERRARPAPLETAHNRAAQSAHVVDFIQLAPMTPDDLSGSLQIVPIRIGDTPADLLLGEDGMAKAIRVSSSSSDPHVFWRSH
jgi:hypothetical protein